MTLRKLVSARNMGKGIIKYSKYTMKPLRLIVLFAIVECGS